MRVVGQDRLAAFCKQHRDARPWIEIWLFDVGGSTWLIPADIRRRYSSASLLPHNTVIFNVKGNKYRLEVTVAYRTGIVVINWIGTHAEYDRRNRRH